MKKRIRLFQAGDMPGKNEKINLGQVKQLVEALNGFEAFGYTHKSPHIGNNAEAIKYCNNNGVCINLSANNLEHADELLKLEIGPVSVTLPKDSPFKNVTTPGGNKVLVCPAVTTDGKITCATCGGIKGSFCSRVDREYVVGFPAHGSSVNRASKIAQGNISKTIKNVMLKVERKMAEAIVKSEHTYIIFAQRNKSQFGQKHQTMRCKVLEAHRDHMLVESLKRYNQKYAGADKASAGKYKGIPVRRVNREQALVIIDEKTNQVLSWETIRRREGTSDMPGRARGGK